MNPQDKPIEAFGHADFKAQLAPDPAQAGLYIARYGKYEIRTAFQPIVSLTHARVVGHEGLLRATNPGGVPVPPPVVLNEAIANGDILHLDRLCRTLHVANANSALSGWLFLNIHPDSFSQSQQAQVSRTSFMASLVEENRMDANTLVLEILEELIEDESHFSNTVGQLRKLGCLLAIDDFGAGHSNFDRVWQISPEIIKLDRRFAVQCEADPRARRMLPRIVNMLHEAGSLVLLEGIETLTQAMIALESDVDFAQGFYFARPAPHPLPIHQVMPLVTDLWERFDAESHLNYKHQRAHVAPYERALANAALSIATGTPMSEACGDFLDLPEAEVCYLLDEQGMQVGSNVWSKHADIEDVRNYKPIAGINGARWSRRPYFRRAIEQFGQSQSTRPYLSTASGHLCMTISIAFHSGTETRVLCGDFRWA